MRDEAKICKFLRECVWESFGIPVAAEGFGPLGMWRNVCSTRLAEELEKWWGFDSIFEDFYLPDFSLSQQNSSHRNTMKKNLSFQ